MSTKKTTKYICHSGFLALNYTWKKSIMWEIVGGRRSPTLVNINNTTYYYVYQTPKKKNKQIIRNSFELSNYNFWSIYQPIYSIRIDWLMYMYVVCSPMIKWVIQLKTYPNWVCAMFNGKNTPDALEFVSNGVRCTTYKVFRSGTKRLNSN